MNFRTAREKRFQAWVRDYCKGKKIRNPETGKNIAYSTAISGKYPKLDDKIYEEFQEWSLKEGWEGQQNISKTRNPREFQRAVKEILQDGVGLKTKTHNGKELNVTWEPGGKKIKIDVGGKSEILPPGHAGLSAIMKAVYGEDVEEKIKRKKKAMRVVNRYLKTATIWRVEIAPGAHWSETVKGLVFGKDGPFHSLVEADSPEEAVRGFASEHSLNESYFIAAPFPGKVAFWFSDDPYPSLIAGWTRIDPKKPPLSNRDMETAFWNKQRGYVLVISLKQATGGGFDFLWEYFDGDKYPNIGQRVKSGAGRTNPKERSGRQALTFAFTKALQGHPRRLH